MSRADWLAKARLFWSLGARETFRFCLAQAKEQR